VHPGPQHNRHVSGKQRTDACYTLQAPSLQCPPAVGNVCESSRHGGGATCVSISTAAVVGTSHIPPREHPALRRFHHIGIPTTDHRPDEEHLPEFGLHVSGFEASPYGVEWMRFDPDSPLPELVKTVPHVAFEVDDLEEELIGQELLIAPNSPSPGVRVAFIVHNGAPIEFLEIRREG
jgi:hypothetical protein